MSIKLPEGMPILAMDSPTFAEDFAATLVEDNAAYCRGPTASILDANADAIRALEVSHAD